MLPHQLLNRSCIACRYAGTSTMVLKPGLAMRRVLIRSISSLRAYRASAWIM